MTEKRMFLYLCEMQKIKCFVLISALTITCYLLPIICNAQDTTTLITIAKKDSIKPKRYFVGAIGGYSHLLGNLAEQVYVDPKSGFVNPNGYNAGIEGVYFLTERFGFNGLLSFSSHYVSQIGLDSLAVGYQRDYNSDSAKVGTNTRYNFFNLLAGPYYSLPLKNKKTSIDFRLLSGFTYIRTAELNMVIINACVPHPFAQNVSKGVALAAQGGIALLHSLGKNVCVKLSADCYYSNPNIKINNSNTPTGVREITNYHQPIITLHFSFGIYYKFGL
jgi:hypothetical protein